MVPQYKFSMSVESVIGFVVKYAELFMGCSKFSNIYVLINQTKRHFRNFNIILVAKHRVLCYISFAFICTVYIFINHDMVSTQKPS